MRKAKKILISLILIFVYIFDINVLAASGNLSVSSASVHVGDSFTVTANINSAAAWNVHVSSSGPVNGCSIVQADTTADAMDTNKRFTTTCTATGEGTITIIMSGDVTSASDGKAVNIGGSRSVSVTKKILIPSNNKNNQNNSSSQSNDNKSKNTNLKELKVEGYELKKVDANNYTLSVPNDVTSINIKATVEDSKAKVTGTGNHNINIGENNIEVVVTAENGSQNKINIKVIRKEGYYLEDLDSLLKNSKTNNINITINSDTKITAKDLEKIKNSKKTVKFNYYNSDKVLMYSWILNGSKLKKVSNLITTLSNNTENKKSMLKLSNYADGIFVGLKQKNNLPLGARIKLFVGDKYKSKDFVNIYAYTKDKNKFKLINKKVKVNKGYIEFDIVDASDYLVTMSNIQNSDSDVKTKKTLSPGLLILTIFIYILAIGILVFTIIKFKKRKNKNDENATVNNMTNNINSTNTNILDENMVNTNDDYTNQSIDDDII